MSNAPSFDYEAEIRAFLLGRIAKDRQSGTIPKQGRDLLPTGRIQSWWILEGKEYRGIGRRLAGQWVLLDRHIRLLRSTFNPRWRAVQSPEGEVDWVATAFKALTSPSSEFVCKSSFAGLTGEEAAALDGWQSWIAAIWAEHMEQVGLPPGVTSGDLPWKPLYSAEELGLPQLRRWAHTARRSRWPLLRNVVAESLRVLLEGQELDILPLPKEPARLFELLCIVRVLRYLCAPSDGVRWLDRDAGGNQIMAPRITCTYQRSLGREDLLSPGEYSAELELAIRRHQVALPKVIDILIEFKFPRAGFHGILLEAKSGEQGFDAALGQLRAYRAALRGSIPGPLLVWGVTEREEDPAECARACAEVKQAAGDGPSRDVWFFSSATGIPAVLEALGMMGDSRPTIQAAVS